MPTTEVILTEKIYNLGAEADVVKVKVGFARNFLIPSGKALEVTPVAMRRINILKAKRAEREAQEMNEAQELARRVNKMKLNMELETGGTGKAFGSITATDIADKLRIELGGKADIDRHKINLERPIKESGTHEVEVKLHADVIAKLSVVVKAKGAPEAPTAAEGDSDESAETPAGGYKAKAKAKHKE